jgi:hypothetical protein
MEDLGMPDLNEPFGAGRRLIVVHVPIGVVGNAVDSFLWRHPGDSCVYKLLRVYEEHTVVSTSGTLALRKVTASATAPGAAAGATVIELLNATTIDLAAVVNTAQTPLLIASEASRSFVTGNKLGAKYGGTLTGLAGCLLTLVFRKAAY